MRRSIFFLLILTIAPQERSNKFDVVVYGGTAGGVITAVSAAREGLIVALLEPGDHLGGMVSGGLSATDHGKKETIGGYSLEFFQRCGKQYGKEIEWYPEPHVAEKVFQEMIAEAKTVTVFLRHRLKEKGGVKKKGALLTEIQTDNGARFSGEIFVDSSYEGDLMAQAGVSYTWGRESASQYNESLAGVRPKDKNHQFDFPVSAYGENKQILPEIQKEPRGEIGAGDRKVQAYNFRLIFTKDPNDRLPFTKPSGYDPKQFELLARFLAEFQKAKGRPPRVGEILSPRAIANNKFDVNNNGPFSTDYIGKSWEYPNASYQRRAEIRQDHVNYTQGLLYFLATDPRVPMQTQNELKEYGPAKDEFADNGNWPYQLYIREARRMVGGFVMTQKDIQTELTKPDVIGMGSYNSDSHNVQRYVAPEGTAQNEGNMEVPVTPYQIPYRIILPRNNEAGNLLVPVCFSASHVTYSTLRMEPVYMIIGQAAGVAAKLAIEKKSPVEAIDTTALVEKLRGQGAVMEWKRPADQIDGDRIARFERQLEELREKLKIPGLSAAIVADQKVVWAKGFGYADLENKTPATPETNYRIASLTKTFASMLLMQLVEQGKLDLEDPMSKFSPEFQQKFKNDAIKVRHVFTHTSHDTPGEKYRYDGNRFSYLTDVIEKASGKSMRELAVRNILDKIDMSSTVPGQDILDDKAKWSAFLDDEHTRRYAGGLAKLAKPYRLYGDEIVQSSYPSRRLSSSAGIVSNVLDLAKYDAAVDRHTFIKAETQERAWTPAVSTTGETLPYGLGWFSQQYRGLRLIWHYGYWPDSFSALYLKVPEKKITLLLLANSDGLSSAAPGLGGGSVVSSAFAVDFLRIFVLEESLKRKLPDPHWSQPHDRFNTEIAGMAKGTGDYRYDEEKAAHESLSRWLEERRSAARKEVKIDPGAIEKYLGKYEIEPGRVITISREGEKFF
ncbi:MAG: FAD-dependent oxidoreductase, partial [Blastocatellia bacterium]|nr:FAD-dependent oxidoreductase [Blastocatellia bacterium]